MDTISFFAIGCLILAMTAGFAGVIVGSHQLLLAGSIVAIISAITIFIVIAIEIRAQRRFERRVSCSSLLQETCWLRNESGHLLPSHRPRFTD
jgi:hypothetical protein